MLARNKLRASPRERELIRYALMPGDCPLVDPQRIAGPLPEDPEALPGWQRDFEVLARLELLSQCRIRPEDALRLASSADAAELLAGLRATRSRRGLGRQHPPGKRPGGARGAQGAEERPLGGVKPTKGKDEDD